MRAQATVTTATGCTLVTGKIAAVATTTPPAFPRAISRTGASARTVSAVTDGFVNSWTDVRPTMAAVELTGGENQVGPK